MDLARLLLPSHLRDQRREGRHHLQVRRFFVIFSAIASVVTTLMVAGGLLQEAQRLNLLIGIIVHLPIILLPVIAGGLAMAALMVEQRNTTQNPTTYSDDEPFGAPNPPTSFTSRLDGLWQILAAATLLWYVLFAALWAVMRFYADPGQGLVETSPLTSHLLPVCSLVPTILPERTRFAYIIALTPIAILLNSPLGQAPTVDSVSVAGSHLIISFLQVALTTWLLHKATRLDNSEREHWEELDSVVTGRADDLANQRANDFIHDRVLSALAPVAAGVADHSQVRRAALQAIQALSDSQRGASPVPVSEVFDSISEQITAIGGDVRLTVRVDNDVLLPAEVVVALTDATLEAVSNSRRHAAPKPKPGTYQPIIATGDQTGPITALNPARVAAREAALHPDTPSDNPWDTLDPTHQPRIRRRVRMNSDDSGVEIRILDNGQGFRIGSTSDLRHGLRKSLYRRMEEIGGSAGILTGPGSGTLVRLGWINSSPMCIPVVPWERSDSGDSGPSRNSSASGGPRAARNAGTRPGLGGAKGASTSAAASGNLSTPGTPAATSAPSPHSGHFQARISAGAPRAAHPVHAATLSAPEEETSPRDAFEERLYVDYQPLVDRFPSAMETIPARIVGCTGLLIQIYSVLVHLGDYQPPLIPISGLVLYAIAAFLVLRKWPSSIVPRPLAMVVALLTGLGSFCVIIPAPYPALPGWASWGAGGAALLVCALIVRTRPLAAWTALILTIWAVTIWTLRHGGGWTDLVPMVGVHIVMTLLWDFVTRTAVKTSDMMRRLMIQRQRKAAQHRIQDRVQSVMTSTLATVSRRAGPVLEAIASGRIHEPGVRKEALLLEAELRDGIRAPFFAGTTVTAAARHARAGGVEVVLVDDSRGVPLRDEVRERVLARARRAVFETRSGRIVVRLLPPGRPSTATIAREGDVVRFLDENGFFAGDTPVRGIPLGPGGDSGADAISDARSLKTLLDEGGAPLDASPETKPVPVMDERRRAAVAAARAAAAQRAAAAERATSGDGGEGEAGPGDRGAGEGGGSSAESGPPSYPPSDSRGG
ncbi:MAG: hypothetical protein Q4C87_07380 [Actinomycetaceae bacterium]|nr:hypothetical protein [Actinomycetaceae bacterium]